MSLKILRESVETAIGWVKGRHSNVTKFQNDIIGAAANPDGVIVTANGSELEQLLQVSAGLRLAVETMKGAPYRVTRAEAYSILDSERSYQEMRIGRDGSTSNTPEHYHTPEEFILYMEHYLQLARETASTTWGPSAKAKTMDVLRKVTALGVAAIEANGCPRREGH